MNRNKLKSYAPQARRDFIQAMTDRAAYYGLTEKKTEPVVEKGDVAVIGGRSFPVAVAKKRQALEDRIQRHGFEQTMEAMAYTWFNRLVAIRFMELHGYLDHGYRVLSTTKHTNDTKEAVEEAAANSSYNSNDPSSSFRVFSVFRGSNIPEILLHAEHVELPGLKKDVVIDLKLAGNKEGELYRLLLTAQCNALHTAMPFLFERIDDETELLLPDNLLNSDSLMRKLVGEIEEEDWKEVEIIGWLYQFYISEKKDEVIGKVVASEDIPAATQLFTPNWIVKYLVQNTLGRQWLATYPQSALRQQMEYYIEPSEQTPEVQEQLKAITPTSLNPEELTLLDPACGSAHILVEAYDLFKAIYQERGYRAKDIPALILQKNLFGMEIDDRAAQLAAFALMMKARADDRNLFTKGLSGKALAAGSSDANPYATPAASALPLTAQPNILAFEDSQGMKASEIHFALTSPLKGEKDGELESPAPDGHLFEPDDNLFTRAEAAKAAASRTPTTVNFSQADIGSLLELFENAKTFGSLIQVPPKLAAKLPEIEKRLDDVLKFGDLTHASAHVLTPLLQQARLLSSQYNTVVANPPYMGDKYFSEALKQFVTKNYKPAKADLYACFILRNSAFLKANGFVGMITIPNWMFISSFEEVRSYLLDVQTFDSFVHNGRGVFGSDFGSCAFTFRNCNLPKYQAVFRRLFDKQGSVASNEELESRLITASNQFASAVDFRKLPGSPLSFWATNKVRTVFATCPSLKDVSITKKGMATGDNDRFVRNWWEVSVGKCGFGLTREEVQQSGKKWFPLANGGNFRKWYGHHEDVVMWENDGLILRTERVTDGDRIRATNHNLDVIFSAGVTWTSVSSSFFGVRLLPKGFIFSSVSSSLFSSGHDTDALLALLNSKVAPVLVNLLNPTVHFNPGDISRIPFVSSPSVSAGAAQLGRSASELAKTDWDSCEKSWDFQQVPVRRHVMPQLCESLAASDRESVSRFDRMRQLEEENNRIFIEAYGLQDELSPEVPDDQITLYRPDREEDIKRLLSYAIGCIMGRYSLDAPGLIYAHSGNQGFDSIQCKTFRADEDGIIPLLETDWGIRDDATNRFVEFVSAAWPKEHLEENLKFIADSLGSNKGEQSRETIRRYLATGFYKHHLSMYKKRPIYWLFSSGKQRAFQCLVYLHRYHEGSLARMRTEYVIPLQGQIAGRIEQLEGDKLKATSTSHRKKLQKEQDDLKKQQTELLTFEEKLKHAADQKITLDLDDGVKVNYGKFGDLLAETKGICGTKDED